MEKLTDTTRALMEERFGHDAIISLATAVDGVPHVRRHQQANLVIMVQRLHADLAYPGKLSYLQHDVPLLV